VLASYAVGLCSLSRFETVTTYLVLALGGAYCNLLAASAPEAAPAPLGRVFGRLAVVSACFVVCLYLFVRVVT
jgi:hypothetical protein